MRNYRNSERIVMAFVNNSAVSDIVKETGLSRATIYRIRGDTDFMRIVAERKGEIIKAVVAKLRANLTKNIDTLQTIIDDEKTAPQVKINAINVMLTQYREFAGTEEIIERLEILESNMYSTETYSGGTA